MTSKTPRAQILLLPVLAKELLRLALGKKGTHIMYVPSLASLTRENVEVYCWIVW